MTSPVLRFAPSPNGPLHLGHALSALTGFDMAQRAGGRFLVRIEDIDVTRCREEYVTGIFEDLSWLGITWEQPVLFQSQQFATYVEAAQWLEGQGLLYPCFASRTEIDAAPVPGAVDPDGAPLYPGLHKALPKSEIEARMENGERFALRIDMDRALAKARDRLGGAPLTFTELDEAGNAVVVEARPERWGDAVILRKDVPASYHLAVVVDDARQGITYVTRGQDLYAATDLHRLLQVLMGLPEPVYHHHRLLADAEGRKLSKSAGDTALSALRTARKSAADIRAMVGLA
ncbi:Glutamyl-Q tRNA(Asp) synthetase [Hyphomicrobium sp. 1Nfss2.1]|uniref:tRNA glutamyl-Q(34) synthetase GluQRS n=1 Tax=Hyphomicrobium sp. 1Nfss2.1 TaxID=3413936 RepID=UPI003C7BE376